LAKQTSFYRLRRFFSRILPDRHYARLAFLKHHGRFPRTPPVTFNERICSRVASGELAQYQPYSDKLAVRDFVARTIGAEYLVPQIATAKTLSRELWDSLPQSFIVKPNHGSGWSRLVRNKSAERFEAVAAETRGWLEMNFYYARRERQYRDIPPRLIFEQILMPLQGDELEDYKILCFHGKARLLHVTLRNPLSRRLLYDMDWNKLRVRYTYSNDGDLPRPARLAEMERLANALSSGFDFVRVDLYSAREGVFFGELTFTPVAASDAFDPPEFDAFLGALWASPDAPADMAPWRGPAPSR